MIFPPNIMRMRILGGACGVLVAFTTLISAQQSSVVVEISPVVHVAAPFSALLRLPASSALKKGGIEAKASLVDAKGDEIELTKLKLVVSTGGQVVLEHELEGLVVRYAERYDSNEHSNRHAEFRLPFCCCRHTIRPWT